MSRHRAEFAVKRMARVFVVSRSGFYGWCRRQQQPATRTRVRRALDQQVAQAFLARKGRYGAPRLTADLMAAGTPANRKTVAASLNRQGFRAKAARKFKATTNANHNLPVAPNVLQQDFTATQPNQKWVGDITPAFAGAGSICGATRAGCIWRRSSTGTAVGWWAGRCRSA